jgi:hypothetical protein
MAKKILMTFDLKDAEGNDYEPGYEALVHLGLSRVSAQKKLRLPFSSVLGDIADEYGKTAGEIAQKLKDVIQDATTKKTVERIAVAIVSDSAVIGAPDKQLHLEELLARFEAATLRTG